MSSPFRFGCASFTVLMSAASCFADPTLVALTGGTAPGGTGGTYSSFTNPVLNASGQVAFQAVLAGGSSTSGIFTGLAGAPAALQAVALQGTAAPSGGNYGTLASASATTVTANLNSTGVVAFLAPLSGGTSTSGIFAGASAATLQAVALQGTAAPSGGNYNVFAATAINSGTSPAINPAGQLAFASSLTGGTPSPGNGVFVGAPGSLQTAALLGAPTPSGGVYTTTFTAPTLNNNGQVAFISLVGAAQGIFAGAPGAIQTVMLTGNAAPGTASQVYGNPSTTYSYNNAGQVAFQSTLTGGTPTSGIFVGAPGSVQAAALNSAVAPGGTGGTYTTFSNVTVNGQGRVAFTSTLTGGTAASGQFAGTPGSIQAIALVGANAPANGTQYASFSSGVVQNGVGQVAFLANLTGGGVVTGSNSLALFAGTPGNLQEAVRTGSLVDVDPGIGTDFRTVNGIGFLINDAGQDGKGSNFNDSGILTYRLTFTDGSIGIFTSPIPEPASLSLLALAGLGLRRRRR